MLQPERYSLHPSVGVARVGNAPSSFYLAPEALGGLPLECDAAGNAILRDGKPVAVRSFKIDGAIRRQAARFAVYRWDDQGRAEEVTLATPGVKRIAWTVHLANKKACWFEWNEVGDLDASPHERPGCPLRNDSVKGDARATLLIDPGPRTLEGASQRAGFSRDMVPADYRHANFPPAQAGTVPIDTLGDMLTDRDGRLLVVPGEGRTSGAGAPPSFLGGDGWYDDIADGPVRCTVEFDAEETAELDAWCIVGPPKFAPQLVNSVTLDDVMYDVAVRHFTIPFAVDFSRDVAPILARPARLAWVMNQPAIVAPFPPDFDPADAAVEYEPARRRLAACFRRPEDAARLHGANGLPMLPLAAGNNPLTNQNSSRFLTLTPTQTRILDAWVAGDFANAATPPAIAGVHALDRASVGNCVGGPYSPGFEVSFSVRNPKLYRRPWRIKHRKADYAATGLDPAWNETLEEDGGCEPGDLTKRLSSPWQADFNACGVEPVSLNAGDAVDASNVPIPPTFLVPWWPAQAPVAVLAGAADAGEQAMAGVPAGTQVQFMRGLTDIDDTLNGWTYLGFVVDRATDGATYFSEVERKHDEFVVSAVAVGDASNTLAPSCTTFVPLFYLKKRGRGVARRA